jgi:hypothetical protein
MDLAELARPKRGRTRQEKPLISLINLIVCRFS